MAIYTNTNDTIFALASGQGKSGVAVIRISGQKALQTAKQLCKNDNNQCFKPNMLNYQTLYNANGDVLDKALVVYFKTPSSFTGEDVVEFHTHGSTAVINSVLQALGNISSDIRLATRGEFTRRAFQNGKMDMTEVEGLGDLIDAQTEQQRKIAIAQMSGGLSKKCETWRQSLIKTLADLEACIDFSTDEIPAETEQNIDNNIENLSTQLQTFLNDNNKGQILRSGLSVAIIGPTNAGKSTLFNAIIGEEKAIISSIAGTTRDIVDANIDINGYPVNIADTAGLRETLDVIEEEGIRRALNKAENAHIVICVNDSLDGLNADIEKFKNKADIIAVLNKADVLSENQKAKDKNIISISAKTGLAMEKFYEVFHQKISEKMDVNEGAIITRQRHRQSIQNALNYLKESLSADLLEIKAESVKLATSELSKLVGTIDLESIYDEIFSSFCIGK